MSIYDKIKSVPKKIANNIGIMLLASATHSVVSFTAAQFHRSFLKHDDLENGHSSNREPILPTDNFAVYNYMVDQCYFEEMEKNRGDAFIAFKSTPKNLPDSANVENYKKIHLDLGEEISINDALKQAAMAKKDTLLIEADQWLTEENKYCILPINKVLSVKKHNDESQAKLGLDGVPITIYNTRIFGTHNEPLPLSLNVDPDDWNRSTACINYILDHETGHAKQTLNNPVAGLNTAFSFWADLALETTGRNFKSSREDDADFIAAKLDKKNVAGSLEYFVADSLDKCSTNEQRIRLLNNLYKEKPSTHSTSIQRVTNILNVAENRGPQN